VSSTVVPLVPGSPVLVSAPVLVPVSASVVLLSLPEPVVGRPLDPEVEPSVEVGVPVVLMVTPVTPVEPVEPVEPGAAPEPLLPSLSLALLPVPP